MHRYRTHTCGQLRATHESTSVRLSGWVHRKRDHGDLLFIDVRDHYGLTQCVIERGCAGFTLAESLKLESVITLDGRVLKRAEGTTNPKMPTGEIEVHIQTLHLESAADPLPVNVSTDQDFPEETRLTYRFLDLRREKMHENIVLRSKVISSLRRRMIDQGFLEYQTPILTASSPEGARDFLVPSRIHPGKFYALPQAPQMFKQLLMVAGFDRYFQIAPCFRDEDARRDRSPGEFYQLDFEMSFVTQEDVFAALEPVLHGVFSEFAPDKAITPTPFPRIPYDQAMLEFGCDKPDLRNPLKIKDVTSCFAQSDFAIFSQAIDKGAIVRAINVPGAASQPRSFFDKMNTWAREQGAPGLGYIQFTSEGAKGPIAKFMTEERLAQLKAACTIGNEDAVFFVCDTEKKAAPLAGACRTNWPKNWI
jgi:aspartyl-tRNA synthetase